MTPAGLSEEILAPIRLGFFVECDELLAELEAGLLALQAGAYDPKIVDAVFRAAHSIKGSAGAFGFARLERFSHAFESALDAVRSETVALDPDLFRLLLRAADALTDIVNAARDGDEAAGPPTDSDALLVALAALAPVRTARPDSEDDDDGFAFPPTPVVLTFASPRCWMIRLRPHASLYAAANEPLLLLRELGRLGDISVALDATALPELGDLQPEEGYLAWTVTLVTNENEAAIREVFAFVEGSCDLSIRQESDVVHEAEGPRTHPAEPVVAVETPTRTIRVDLDRIDRLVNLVGEQVISQSMLRQRMIDAGLSAAPGMEGPLDDLAHLTRDLQESVMAIRAQPVKVVFQRLSRIVRDVAAATGKQVRLTVAGENTEVDRTVIERLTDPLTHMIRNAIDHGIEPPHCRRAAGKPEEGVIHVSAAHRGGRVIIEVTDDGAGLDRAAVRQTALRRGLVSPDALLSDDEVDGLIFAPGFSTSTELSALSGRGVGMDVVKRGVQALGGRIAVTSQPGEGACFTLTLPLTLAVLEGMVVSVAGHSLVAPLSSLVESVRANPAALRQLGSQTCLLSYRGEYLPLIDLGIAFGYRQVAPDAGMGAVLVVEDGLGGRAALLVDEILGQRQVVIKSLETHYRAVPGLAAATILGDGRVALILDVDAVVATHRPAATAAPLRRATG
ncbi:MAG: CheA signal transduction histidine kinase [Caulobacteraceae bacterium]|nr:CheA signal transduction histidine kinase [Caulobacteraceae bacterium]